MAGIYSCAFLINLFSANYKAIILILSVNLHMVFIYKFSFFINQILRFFNCIPRISKKKTLWGGVAKNFKLRGPFCFSSFIIFVFYQLELIYCSVILANTYVNIYQYWGKTILSYDHPDGSKCKN